MQWSAQCWDEKRYAGTPTYLSVCVCVCVFAKAQGIQRKSFRQLCAALKRRKVRSSVLPAKYPMNWNEKVLRQRRQRNIRFDSVYWQPSCLNVCAVQKPHFRCGQLRLRATCHTAQFTRCSSAQCLQWYLYKNKNKPKWTSEKIRRIQKKRTRKKSALRQ